MTAHAHTRPVAPAMLSNRVLASTATGLLVAPPVALFAPDARVVLLNFALTVAAACDVRTRRIPNWLTAGAGAFALTASPSPLTALGGALVALLAGTLLVLAARDAYGVGDVKAMAVAGATVGLASVPLFLCWMAIAGGVWAASSALRTRSLRGQTVAYAPAIAAGCLLTLLLR